MLSYLINAIEELALAVEVAVVFRIRNFVKRNVFLPQILCSALVHMSCEVGSSRFEVMKAVRTLFTTVIKQSLQGTLDNLSFIELSISQKFKSFAYFFL